MIHRLANDPPCGIVDTDKKLSLCGRYLRIKFLTVLADRVECQTCRESATSERTATHARIAVTPLAGMPFIPKDIS